MREIALVFALVVGWMTPAFAPESRDRGGEREVDRALQQGRLRRRRRALHRRRLSISSRLSDRARPRRDRRDVERHGGEGRRPLDVKPLGPAAAREIGTFSLKTKGPNPQEVAGKYVVVWEKAGNDWQLAADIWNDGR
jgi:hypothetical protein